MEMEFVTEEASDDEFYGVDDNTEDYLNFEGERCGICTDVVIDRGVIDCCQHWFCFACIDNWATITSLCPLCQNEFQLITCVPVYDTVGGNKTDEDTSLRDDDWFVEGKTNTLSFPSYYIDENAVVCLDGDGCKIRSGSVAIEEDSDVDTSIACDSCDKWYHAFCVGFDPEVTCDSSWLCPRCSSNEGPKKTDGVSVFRKSDQNDLEIAGGDCLAEVAFSGEVSVSVVDDGETAVIMSLVEGSDNKEESSAAVLGCSKDMDKTLLSSSLSNLTNSESLPGDIDKVEQNSGQQENALYFSQDVRDASVDGPESMGPTSKSEEYLLPADNKVPNKMEVLSFESMNLDEKETAIGIAGAKRKHTDSRKVADGEAEATLEGKFSRKKIKDERNTKLVSQRDQTVASVSRQNNLRDTKIKSSSENENGSSDIMDIVRGTDRRSLNQLGQKNSSGINPKERETASGLRLKKIMRQAGDDKDSSALQELRKKIREAVRNKSSNDSGQNLFDQKLLDAFRASLAASGDETRKPTLDVKAKKSLLQKGKVRESLTKKIYGTGGKRRRAWTRECEVEFWKHRCIKTSKPEKIQALKSVLDVLKDNSDQTKRTPENEEEAKGSILSRLYLADASVFPKKDDVKPVSALQADPNCEQKNDNDLSKKVSTSLSIDQSDKNAQKQNLLDGNEMKKSVNGMKSGTASGNARQKGCPKGASTPSSSATKDMVGKSDDIKSDKRKWALELLARKTAVSGKTMQEKEEDTTILKGNYTLLAQLQKDMRPVLAPSRHNKIPTSVRQAQLYRLTEHFLKKANLSTVCRTAETELAVADAVNIEKQVADRSNSKLVYVNLCSQELLRRSDDVKSDKAQEAHPSSTTEGPSETEFEETKDCSSDLAVDEALRKAGLMSDSPPNSPKHEIEEMNDKVGSPEVTAEGQTDNVIEIDSNPELDIYGDFEYSLEDDDFISASAFNVAKPQPEPPKIKMVFSSLQPEKPNVALADVEALNGSFESLNKTTTGGSTVDGIMRDSTVQNSSVGNDEELDPDECEVLYGPDKEPIIVKFPETLSITPVGPTVQNDLPGEKERDSGQPSEDQMGKSDDGSTPSTSNVPENKNVSKQKTTKCDKKQTEQCNMVTKKVEAYIKEHIRPLCKSGVITVEQYRWAVGKTSEKVMKYHSKEKNANFLIKEGEKVKKLAEQYVETAQQQAKN